VEHPFCYFIKKLDKHQIRYSAVEKEALPVVLALGALKIRDWKMLDWNYREQETYGTPRVA